MRQTTIDTIIGISLSDFGLIDEVILFLDGRSHFFPERLKLEPNVMDVIVNLFFKFGEDVGQVLIFELSDDLLHKRFTVGVGCHASLCLVDGRSRFIIFGVDSWIVLRTLLALWVVLVGRQQALEGVALMGRLSLAGNATLVNGANGIILLKAEDALVKTKVVLSIVDGTVCDGLVLLRSDERLLHGGVNGKLQGINARVWGS